MNKVYHSLPAMLGKCEQQNPGNFCQPELAMRSGRKNGKKFSIF
jgi:hypothetical protein